MNTLCRIRSTSQPFFLAASCFPGIPVILSARWTCGSVCSCRCHKATRLPSGYCKQPRSGKTRAERRADFTFNLVKRPMKLRPEGRLAAAGRAPRAPACLRGHRGSCQTCRSAPAARPPRRSDPTAAAGQTLCGKPPAAPGWAPNLLCQPWTKHKDECKKNIRLTENVYDLNNAGLVLW